MGIYYREKEWRSIGHRYLLVILYLNLRCRSTFMQLIQRARGRVGGVREGGLFENFHIEIV